LLCLAYHDKAFFASFYQAFSIRFDRDLAIRKLDPAFFKLFSHNNILYGISPFWFYEGGKEGLNWKTWDT